MFQHTVEENDCALKQHGTHSLSIKKLKLECLCVHGADRIRFIHFLEMIHVTWIRAVGHIVTFTLSLEHVNALIHA